MARNRDKENDAPPGTSVLAINGKPVKASKPRAVWNKLTVQVLIATLLAQKAEGNQTDNSSWKPEAFNACAKALAGTETGVNGSGGPPKTAKMCMTRWTAEKADYLVFRTLRGLSGVGWNDETDTIVVEDGAHPRVEKYRYKSFPWYDDMASLVDGGFATGDQSFAPSQQPSDADNTHDDDELDFPLDPALRGDSGIYRPESQDEDETPLPGWGPSSDNEEPVEVEAPKNPRKRTRALSDSPPDSASTGKRHRSDGHGRKPSTGHAMLAVSESLKEVANALARDPSGPSSPQRKTQAVGIVKNMTLNLQNRIRALQLIRADTSVADVLLAIEDDTEMSINFLLAEIQARTVA
ncbi:Myb-DNA-bind-3 domain-containing protein [Mycena venus]|uniref:Myb-DNA-bind-3 domain-containing protein n=1 Tax=Mycena venus TaxID=2733690 RepID=A0A8H6YWT2_9AGAR|nr:Myb-DNA-bind-3 domain-containing protein [Mycena venus]